MTLHPEAAVWRSGMPLRFISTRGLVHPFAANAAFPLKGKQETVPLPPAPLEMARAQSTAEPCAPLRGRGPRSGAGVLYRKSLKWHSPKSRPPFGGQGSLCASSLHAALYTLLPLRGISPQGETRRLCRCPPPAPLETVRAQSTASPCAPLRGRGPRSGAGVLYGKSLG